MSDRRPGLSARAVDTVAIIVAGTWGVSFVADIWVPAYDSPPGLHQVMMLIVGFLVAGGRVAEKKEADAKPDETKTDAKTDDDGKGKAP